MSYARLQTATVQPMPLHRLDGLVPMATLVFTVNFVAYFLLPDLLPDLWRWLAPGWASPTSRFAFARRLAPSPVKLWNHERAVSTLRNYVRTVLPLETAAFFLWYWADHANWARCYDTTGRWSARDYAARGCPSDEGVFIDCVLYLLVVGVFGRLLVFVACRAGEAIESPLEVMPRNAFEAAGWAAIHVVPLFGLRHLAPPQILALVSAAHALRAYANCGGRACGGLVAFGGKEEPEQPQSAPEPARVPPAAPRPPRETPAARVYTPLPSVRD